MMTILRVNMSFCHHTIHDHQEGKFEQQTSGAYDGQWWSTNFVVSQEASQGDIPNTKWALNMIALKPTKSGKKYQIISIYVQSR